MYPMKIDRSTFSQTTESERLNAEIMEITMVIAMYCPELSKYLEEMPVIDLSLEADAVRAQSLRLYFDRLYAMMAGYATHAHPSFQA